MFIEYSFSERGEILTECKYFAFFQRIGYQLFNLISMETDEIERILNSENISSNICVEFNGLMNFIGSDFSSKQSLDFDEAAYLYFPTIREEYRKDRKQFISDILLVKIFFELSNSNSNENVLPFSLDGLMLFVGCNGLKIPYKYWAIPGIKTYYHKHGPITPADYNKTLQKIKEAINLNVSLILPTDKPNYDTYECNGILDLCLACLHYIFSNDYTVKRCAVCNKFFIAYNRSDTLYCDRTAPQDTQKTCKEYGAYAQYQNNIKNNEAAKLYRNIYQQKQMKVRRNPDITEYKSNFEEYKTRSKQWKKDVKEGKKTEAEYIEWLKAEKEKKVNFNG